MPMLQSAFNRVTGVKIEADGFKLVQESAKLLLVCLLTVYLVMVYGFHLVALFYVKGLFFHHTSHQRQHVCMVIT